MNRQSNSQPREMSNDTFTLIIGLPVLLISAFLIGLMIMAKADEAYAKGHPRTQECRQELQKLTLAAVHHHIHQVCYAAALQRHTKYADEVLSHYKTAADRDQIIGYIYPDIRIPVCGRWRCSALKS